MRMITRLTFGRGITRQQWRVRIETSTNFSAATVLGASPGNDIGCGLKHGLFPDERVRLLHHPAAMPGAD